MAGVGGTVHLRVLPNAETFHTELKKKLEKGKRVDYKVRIDPDLDRFNMALDQAERRIDDLDGRRVRLLLDVNDEQAASAVDDFVRDAEREGITKDLLVDTDRASSQVDQFAQDQVKDPITKHLFVERNYADEEMMDFFEKHDGKVILQKVELDFGKGRDPFGPGGAYGGSRNSKKSIMGVRNPADVDSSALDAVNFMPRMLKNMNSQLDLGIRQVYDSYFTLFSKMYKFTSKPFFDFTNMAREAKTLGEFLTGVAQPVRAMNDGFKKAFATVPRGFRAIRDAGNASLRGIKQIPDLLREISTIAQSPFRLAARSVRKLFDLFSPAAVSAVGKLRGAFVRVGQSLSGGFVNAVNGARMQLRNLAEGFTSSLTLMVSGPLMSKVYDSIRGLGGAGVNAASRLMSGFDFDQIAAHANDLTKGLAGRFAGAGNFLRKALGSPVSGLVEATRDGFGAIGDYWGAASRKIGDATLGLRMGVTRSFRGMTRTVGGLFSKMSDGVRNNFARIGNFMGPLTSRISKGFGGIAGVVGKVLGPGKFQAIFTGLQMGLTRSFRGAFPTITKAFGGLTSTLSKGFGKVLNSPALWKGMQAITRRISTAAMGFSRIMMGAFAKVAGVLMKSLMPALMAVGAGVMALGGQAAIGAVLALAGAFTAVAGGAILMLPAVLGAAAIAFGVLKMGLDGVKDAMGSALSADTVEEFEAAIADAHPAVQNLARAMREFKGPIDDMKSAVQGNMLEGLDVGLRSAMNNLLPIFSEGAQKVATSWNRSLGGVLDELSSDRATSGLTALMAGVEEMSIAMEPTLANLVAAFGSLAEQGAKFLGPLGGWINGLSESFFGWAEGLKEIDETTGISKFDTAMESARVNAGHLGEIFGGLFGTLGNVMQAAAEGGAGLLGGMGEGLRGLQEATEKGTEGYAAIVGFMEGAARAASSLKLIMEPLLMSVVSVGQILADVAYGAMPGLAVGLTGLQIGLQGLTPFAEAFGTSMGGVLEAVAPLLAFLGAALGPALAGLAEGLNKMFEPLKIGGPFDGFYKALAAFGPLLGNTLTVVGEALGKILGAAAPMLESFMGLLNAVLPVFDLWAYWLGEIIAAVLEALEPFMLMRDEAIAGLLDAIKPLIEIIGQGLRGVINALSPLMSMLAYAFSEIVKAVTPLIAPLTVLAEKLFLAVIDVIQMVMPIIPPLVAIIIGLVRVIAEKLIVIINAFIGVWEKVWPKVSEILRWVINDLILPLLGWLMKAFDKLGTFIGWVVDKIIVPIFEGMGTVFEAVLAGMVWVIDHLIKPALDGLKGAFSLAVDGIKAIWEGLKKIFAAPIRFFLETVINNGIIAGWNKIGPKINLGTLEKVNLGDLGGYYSGGVIPGYSPGKDNYDFVDQRTGTRIGLAGGEGIMRQEWVKAVGGPKAVAAMNDAARHGRIKANPSGHSSGGVLSFGNFARGGTLAKNPNVHITTAIQRSMEAAVAAAFPNQIITSGTRYQDVGSGFDNHMAGRALDFAADHSLAQWIARTYPDSAELFWDPGPNIKNGNPTGAIGGHSDHVHWAMASMVDPYTGEVVSQDGPGGGGGGGFGSMVRGLFDEVVSTLFDPLKNLLSDKFSGNTFGMEVVGGLISKTVDATISKLKSALPFGGSEAGNADWEPGAGAMQWKNGVIAAFRRQGEEPTDERVNALLRQIQSESGGNPNIAQQIVDVNGTGPSAGLGLYQFIPGTFAAYRDPGLPNDRTNPEAAHNAAVRYFRDRHGWNTGPGGVGRGHGWKDGGVLPEFFDRGGLAKGIGVLPKNVITPERVLSPAMTAAFDDFVYGFMPELVNEFRNNPRDLARHFGRLTGEITRIHQELRNGHISRLTDTMTSEFRRRANGENLADNPIDLMIDLGWFQRNPTEIAENLNRASRRLGDVVSDPAAYLEAEAAARKRLEEEFEAEREKAKEETDEAKKKAQDEEDEARRKKEQAEDDAAKTDEEREALKAQREAEAEARKDVADAEKEAADQRTKEEEAKIEAAKADGSFYYGYKTFAEDGSNPNSRELTAQENSFRSFMDSLGERTGLGDTVTGVTKRIDMLRSIGEAVQTATPAWMAALNGDPSGLAYNVAVGTAQVRSNAVAEAESLGPSALAGILEMAISGANSNNAPFIENLNAGMTQAELMQTLDHYQARRARTGTGTTRVR